MDIKEGLLLWLTNVLIKKTASKASPKDVVSGVNTQAEPIQKTYENNEKLAEELHKTIIRKFKKRSVYSRFKENIWGADLADMQLMSKFNKRFKFLIVCY